MGAVRRVTPDAIRVAPPDPGPGRPGRDQWHAARRAGIGGSDIAAILGIGRRTALAVYREKTGEPETGRNARLDEAALFGHLHEPVVAAEFGRRTGLRVLPSPGILASRVNPWMLANVDRLVTPVTAGRVPLDQKFPLEIKTRSAYEADKWRDGPDEAPVLQLQWYLAVTGAAYGYVAVLLGGNQLKWWRVDRDDTLIRLMIAAAAEFRDRLAAGVPPPPAENDTELLDAIWAGTPDLVADLDPDVALPAALRLQALRDDAKATAKEITQAENNLKVLLGDAETGVAGGVEICTWKRSGPFRSALFTDAEPDLAAEFQVMRPVIDTDRLAAEYPDKYRYYRSRVLRVTVTGKDRK